MLKHIQSRLHGYYLGQGFGYYNAVLFPLATSERVYVLELPRRVSCYQRADRGVKLVCQVSLKERDRVVTKRRPARTAMPEGRIESLLDYLYVTEVLSEWVAWEGSKEHAISYSLRGSRFAMRDLAARREYVKYDYEPVVSTLYVSLLLADHSKGGRSAGDAYFVEDDPDTITRNKNGYSTDVNAFYRNDGLPAAKAELKLLR